jgi:hypothetical protein
LEFQRLEPARQSGDGTADRTSRMTTLERLVMISRIFVAGGG